MHFILDPFRRDAALFEMFYSLSGLRYPPLSDVTPRRCRSNQLHARPLLNLAERIATEQLRCSSPQIVSKPLLFRAALGNAVAVRGTA